MTKRPQPNAPVSPTNTSGQFGNAGSDHRPGGDGEKPALRRAALARRAGMADAQAPGAARQLAEIHLPFLTDDRAEVSAYVAHGSELDPALLVQGLARAGHTVCLPVVTGPARPLVFRRWRVGDALQAGAMNIPAPVSSAATVEPQILLVPLLIVDRAGFRLGYGGGFYDRTLAALRAKNPDHPPIAVGVCFADQIVEHAPRQPHDQPLDWILTPDGIFKTQNHPRDRP